MVKLKVRQILKKYNIKNDDIENVLNKIIHVENNSIAVFYHHSWGSCREFKFLMTDPNGKYFDGEWLDRSSNKNVHKFKFTDINNLPQVVKVFYYESPSCNVRKKFSFEIIADVIKD
ncbi:MAG: hypothetical protein QXX12_02465 [Nanopusillaceae archaeon]